MQWRIIGKNALQMRFWDGECVVYNTQSGDLHVLGGGAARILQTLQQGPADLMTLVQRFAKEWQCKSSDELLREIEMTVSEMQALSLVEGV